MLLAVFFTVISIMAAGFLIFLYTPRGKRWLRDDFRVFSRNISKRYAENQKYLAKTYKLRTYIQQQKNSLAQRKVYHIYKCPGCKQKIRIPKGKGKIEIRCPKCGTTFIKKS